MPLKPFTCLSSRRVIVRPVHGDDLADLLAVNGDDEVTRFLPYAPWRSIEDGQAWLARMDALATSGTGQQLVIELAESRQVIGTVLLFKHDEPSARVELGYVLGRAHWRLGLATEALQAVCGHAFSQLGVRRIEAEVNPANTASNALLTSLGFRHEGRLRQRWVAKGQIYDTNIYGCLAEDWPNPRPLA